RRLPIFLRLRRLRRTAASQTRRLLRLLLLWIGTVPADPEPPALIVDKGTAPHRKIEVFGTGCPACDYVEELIGRIAGADKSRHAASRCRDGSGAARHSLPFGHRRRRSACRPLRRERSRRGGRPGARAP